MHRRDRDGSTLVRVQRKAHATLEAAVLRAIVEVARVVDAQCNMLRHRQLAAGEGVQAVRLVGEIIVDVRIDVTDTAAEQKAKAADANWHGDDAPVEEAIRPVRESGGTPCRAAVTLELD